MVRVCAVEGCINIAIKRKLCNLHYLREWRANKGFSHERFKALDGEGYLHLDGYRYITVNGRQVGEHVYKAELALGRKLPIGVEVHHMNRDKLDNDTPYNLVICPSHEYHVLLHRRARELGYEKYHGDE